MQVPFVSRFAPQAMVSTVDNLATEAGLFILRQGGNAVDAAIAANAVITVTLPNQCGLGGDLFALVHDGSGAPKVLDGSGHSGAGADPAVLRDEGLTSMPHRGDVRSTTVPGCVDAWCALLERYGRMELADLLAPAIHYASEGFPVSYYLAQAISKPLPSPARDAISAWGDVSPGDRIRRADTARVLTAIAEGGRDAFYRGEFGRGLLELGEGLFTEGDLERSQVRWTDPATKTVWGSTLWTPPPGSQGYLTLSAAWIAEQVGIPDDPDDPMWAHILIESMRQAAVDRPEVLHADANPAELLANARLQPRAANVTRASVAKLDERYTAGGTTHLCVRDSEGMGVSLTQSNGMSFGSRLVVGETGIWLQNRGFAFSLEPGHPAEYGPARRPPHTLSPLMITDGDGRLRALLGTRGGDSQPQILLQLVARFVHAGQDAAEALAAGRWVLRGAADETAFDTWGFHGSVRVALEGQVPSGWDAALSALGHRVESEPSFSHAFGHAQVVLVGDHGLSGAADPRALAEQVAGY